MNRDEVVAAARTMIEQGGAEALSMRKLAAELGVTTTTIYWHVGGRDELILAVIAQVSDELAAHEVVGDGPRERVRCVARLVWQSAFAHRRVTALAHQVGATSLLELPLEVAMAEELEAAGLEGPDVRDALRSILMCVAGFLVVALRRAADAPPEARAPALWSDVDARISPTTRAALADPADVEALFERTVGAVVDSFVPARPRRRPRG